MHPKFSMLTKGSVNQLQTQAADLMQQEQNAELVAWEPPPKPAAPGWSLKTVSKKLQRCFRAAPVNVWHTKETFLIRTSSTAKERKTRNRTNTRTVLQKNFVRTQSNCHQEWASVILWLDYYQNVYFAPGSGLHKSPMCLEYLVLYNASRIWCGRSLFKNVRMTSKTLKCNRVLWDGAAW